MANFKCLIPDNEGLIGISSDKKIIKELKNNFDYDEISSKHNYGLNSLELYNVISFYNRCEDENVKENINNFLENINYHYENSFIDDKEKCNEYLQETLKNIEKGLEEESKDENIKNKLKETEFNSYLSELSKKNGLYNDVVDIVKDGFINEEEQNYTSKQYFFESFLDQIRVGGLIGTFCNDDKIIDFYNEHTDDIVHYIYEEEDQCGQDWVAEYYTNLLTKGYSIDFADILTDPDSVKIALADHICRDVVGIIYDKYSTIDEEIEQYYEQEEEEEEEDER